MRFLLLQQQPHDGPWVIVAQAEDTSDELRHIQRSFKTGVASQIIDTWSFR